MSQDDFGPDLFAGGYDEFLSKTSKSSSKKPLSSPPSLGSYKGGFSAPRCYESHPPLKVGNHLIYGGSCLNPCVQDADIYIGFDQGMQLSRKSWPWLEKPAQEVYFYIRDMDPPEGIKDFKALIEWTALQLIAGKKVHAGCIGGHGRTGTFLAALVTHMTGELDSITYVRANYCKKAVESKGQIEYLHNHFGIKKVEGSKSHVSYGSPKAKSSWPSGTSLKASPKSGPDGKNHMVTWVKSDRNVWVPPR